MSLTTDGARRHTEHGRERKQQLVEAAIALFSERGYAATRVLDICEAAGVAKGLFYWYFPTKEDLFAELVRTMRHRLRSAQGDSMDPAASPLDQLRQGTEASVRFMAAHASYFSVVDVERADPAVAHVLRAGADVYLRDVVALVRAGQRVGDVASGDPHLLALGVLGSVSSFANAWRNGRIDLAPDDLAQFVGDWVVRAVRADAAEAPVAPTGT